MHEFTVVEKGFDLVLCVIYKKNKKEERGLALTLEIPPSVVVDSGILGSPKSVFDQVNFFDGIDDTDIGVKTHMRIKTQLLILVFCVLQRLFFIRWISLMTQPWEVKTYMMIKIHLMKIPYLLPLMVIRNCYCNKL